MVAVLRRDGWAVNRKRVRRLMRVMGLEAIYRKPNTSQRHPAHKVYPYLLRGLVIDQPNQVWCADITYIPMAKGFVYLVAVMDWFSRRVLTWRLSIGMETDFCVEALREAMERHGRPAVFNTDQGVQFTSAAFLDELASQGARISMDGQGRFLDTIFIEETNASEPLMTCRNVFNRRRNRDLDFCPASKGWAMPADGPTGVRHEGGVTSRQASVRNTGTCRPDAKGETQAVSHREGPSTDAGHRGGGARSRVDGSVMGSDRRGVVIQLYLGGNLNRARLFNAAVPSELSPRCNSCEPK